MKRTRIKSILTTKLTRTQIIFSSILLLILFTGLGIFFFSTHAGIKLRMLTYLSLLQDEKSLTQLITPPPPTLIPTPTKIAIPTLSTPTISGPTPIEQLPDLIPNKLVVYQTRYTHENTATLTQTITDATKVKEIYEDINSLPFWPQGGTINCPMDNGMEYVLNFYSHDVLVVHALLNATGCPGVRFTNYKGRMALSPQGRILLEDLRQTLQLSGQEFYGYPK